MKKLFNLVFFFVIIFSTSLIVNGCATIFGWSGPELVNGEVNILPPFTKFF